MNDAEGHAGGAAERADRPAVPSDPGHPGADADPPEGQFRRTLVRVLVIQAVALLALWLLQIRYTV